MIASKAETLFSVNISFCLPIHKPLGRFHGIMTGWSLTCTVEPTVSFLIPACYWGNLRCLPKVTGRESASSGLVQSLRTEWRLGWSG